MVRLGATSLANTVTPKITLKKGDLAKKQCEKPEKELLDSQLLHEERVKFPGDDRGFELNWVGGAPFIQVQVGDNLFEESIGDHTPHPADTVNPTRLRRRRITEDSNNLGTHPLALSLHVKTSDRTFVSGLDKHNKLHLKIEVFFNGQISSCLFLPPYEIRSNTKTHHQVFAGYRVDYLAERPWVVLPPRIAADGSPSKSKSSSSAEDRWKHIGEALNWEADERGMNSDGNTSPTSVFLKALATMGMPDDIRSLQLPGSRNFGVVDVVITAGDGRKVTSGAAYLKAPQRFPDESFPLRAARKGLDDFVSIAEHVGLTSPKVRQGSEAAAVGFDTDAEGESDPENEPQPKRQALARPPSAKSPGLKETLPPQSRIGVEGVPSKAVAPLSNVATSKDPLACAGSRFSTSENPMLEAKDGCSNSMSSPECGRVGHNEYAEYSGLHNLRNVSFGTPHSFYSFPSSSFGLTRTPQMRPSPYSLQYSDSFHGKDSPSGLMGLPSTDYAGFLSSPLQRAPQNISEPCATPHATRPANHNQHTPGDNGVASVPMNLKTAEHRGSLDSAFMPFCVPTGSKNWSQARSELQLQDSMHPLSVPNMWPTSTYPVEFGGPVLDGSLYPSPYDRRLSMPLPPTGLFTVPTKPRTSLSPSKKPRPTNLKMPQGGFLFKRLILAGKNGVAIVDHEWDIAQYVAKTEHSLGNCDASGLPPNSTVGKPLNSETNYGGEATSRPDPEEEAQAKGGKGVKGSYAKLLPRPNSSQSRKSPHECPDGVKRPHSKEIASKVQLERSGPNPKTDADGSLNVNLERAVLKNACLPSVENKINVRDTSGLLVPQRRTVPGANILGVQGPKAATFWLENPEELLRGTTKGRRTKAPTKRMRKPSAASEPTDPTTPAKASDDLSSPLSSLATTPEPGFGLDVNVTRPASAVAAMARVTDPIAQIDGSRERKLASASPAKATRSPMKLALDSTSRLSPKAASTPKPTQSPNVKKRKAEMGRYLPKQPRSPDRLKTISNPPLNRDCVIAFAESEDKESERGVLRQVKSERQGVFAEEYVVFATRFFIAGN